MKLQLLEEIINNIKPGTYTNIVYDVSCPVKAEYKKQGIEVHKTVSMTARFKINYYNIKAVKERIVESNNQKKTNNYKSIVKNAIYYNTNTEKYYLNVYNINKPCIKTIYEVKIPMPNDKDNWNIYPEDQVRDAGILIDSYFRSQNTEMFRINIDNIFSINNRWR